MIYERIVTLKPIDLTIEELLDKIAPDIIEKNRLNNWEYDNKDDILFVLDQYYKIDEPYQQIEDKVIEYLHKQGY